MTFWVTLTVFNFVSLGFNIVINYINNTYNLHERLPITKTDINISLINVVLNILIAIPGYYMFKEGIINFSEKNMIRDFLILLFSVDLLMYLFHRLSHRIYPLTAIHEQHHTHTSFNEFSLYVMNPVESIALGIIITLMAFILQCNIYSFIGFLFINWLYGVISHLNTRATSEIPFWGNQRLHQNHHQLQGFNFGFYTKVWDYLFGTLYQ